MEAVIKKIVYRIAGLMAVSFGVALILYPAHTYAYNYNDIQAQLIGGNSTAVAWDLSCWQTMTANRAAGLNPRTSINQGGSYAGTTWLSAAGLGNTTTIDVAYGTKTVNLQLNSVTFLCSSLVSPDGAGADYPYTNFRVVHSYDTPNDRAPNPMGGKTNWPAMTMNSFRVDSASSTDGGALSLAANQVLQYGRNNSTRYWFGALPFSYTSPSANGLTGDQTIIISVIGRPMVQYYGNQDYCIVGGGGARSSTFNYDRCGQSGSTFTINIHINQSYTLTPSVATDMSGIAEAGSTVNVMPKVKNSGPTNSANTQWQVTQIVVAPGQAVPNAAGGTSPAAITPCGTYFQALPNATCSTIKSGTSVFDTNGNVLSGDPLTTYPVVVGDLAIGTKICFAFSIQPSSNSSDVWTHSAPTCLIIGRKPKLQILGGDLLSNGGVNTSTTNKNIGGMNYTFGSWIEYGIFAVKTITGAASGSAYAGSGLANADNCNTSQLSFTNSGSSTCSPGTPIGDYANSASIPDVASSFPANGAPVFSGGNLTAQASGTYTGSGTINISGGNIVAGKWFVLNAPGATVNISGNITYFNGTMNSISDIPQVIIIAGNINIAGGVTQVDSWLIASGGLNTCSDVVVGAPLSSDICNQALVVNGPVMAGQLYMRRTAGSGAGAAHSGDPAETFNLRPDAYLWASLRSADPNRVQTVYSTELPPRL